MDFVAEDPITGESYDPIGDPVGTLSTSVMYIFGITMTLLLLGIAQSTVLPTVSDLVSGLLGIDSGNGSQTIQFGEP
jgi:hypothetical protein